jgi:hypothetical protein
LLAACKNDIVLVDFNKKNLCHLLKQTGFCWLWNKLILLGLISKHKVSYLV